MPQDVDVAVIGGGPGGLAAAVSLLTANSNLNVKVFERARSLRPAGFVVGILPNALKAIEAINPELRESLVSTVAFKPEEMCSMHYLQDGTLLSKRDGSEFQGRYAKYGGGLFPVAWYDLQCWLASWLPEGVLQTNTEFERYEEDKDGVTAHFRDGSSCKAGLLIGCDGNLSQVRKQLLDDGMPTFGGLAIWRAMTVRPKDWLVKSGMVGFDGHDVKTNIVTIAFPDGRLSWTIGSPWDAAYAGVLGSRRYITDHAKEGTPQEKLDRCLAAMGPNWPQPVLDAIRNTDLSALTEHGLYFREPSPDHKWGAGRVTLLGDAAHLTAAALGQGTSQTMEDALELGRAIALHGCTADALRSYEAIREPLASAVQAASVGLVKRWATHKEADAMQTEQRTSEQFFSRTFEPMPRLTNQGQQPLKQRSTAAAKMPWAAKPPVGRYQLDVRSQVLPHRPSCHAAGKACTGSMRLL